MKILPELLIFLSILVGVVMLYFYKTLPTYHLKLLVVLRLIAPKNINHLLRDSYLGCDVFFWVVAEDKWKIYMIEYTRGHKFWKKILTLQKEWTLFFLIVFRELWTKRDVVALGLKTFFSSLIIVIYSIWLKQNPKIGLLHILQL